MAIGRYLIWLRPNIGSKEETRLPPQVAEAIAMKLKEAQELANFSLICSAYIPEADELQIGMKKHLQDLLDRFEYCGHSLLAIPGEAELRPRSKPTLSERLKAIDLRRGLFDKIHRIQKRIRGHERRCPHCIAARFNAERAASNELEIKRKIWLAHR